MKSNLKTSYLFHNLVVNHKTSIFIFAVSCAPMYILKIKGKAKIPDYIQLRDENLTLLAYFRVDRPDKALTKLGLEEHIENLKVTFEEMPFGKIQTLDV